MLLRLPEGNGVGRRTRALYINCTLYHPVLVLPAHGTLFSKPETRIVALVALVSFGQQLWLNVRYRTLGNRGKSPPLASTPTMKSVGGTFVAKPQYEAQWSVSEN